MSTEAPKQAQRLAVNGTELHVDDTGEVELSPVFCLHSLFLDNRMFESFIDAAEGRYRVIRPEFRGQGRSAPASDSETVIDMDTCVSDIEGVVDHFDLGSAHFLVQSMGGDVGLRLASRRPELFRSMAILGSSACSEPPDQLEEFRQWVEDVGQSGFVGPILDTTMEIMFGETTRNDPSKREMLDLWRDRIASVPPTLKPAMAGVIERSSVVHLLPDIDIPSLVVSGEEDLPRPPAWADEVVKGLPNAELYRLPKVGHSPILEAPDLVIPRILEFFEGVDARSEAALGR